MKLGGALRAVLGGLKSHVQSSWRIPDFNRAFKDGAGFPGQITVERRSVSELGLPSGCLVACDAAFADEPPFEGALNPGSYPVILSIASAKGDKRVACAMLQVKPEPAVAWKPALRQGDKPDSRPGYGVDSATGAFMDAETAAIWRGQAGDDEFFSRVTGQLEAGYGQSCCWGNVTLDTPAGSVSAVIFSTGYGDGYYRSYWGYTADGAVACLVTDFGILEPSVEL